MGVLDDLGDILFGWLVPDQEPPPVGGELTKAATDNWIPKIYGSVSKHKGTIIFKATNDADNDDIPNDLLHIIIVWGYACQSIGEVYIDDIPASSDHPSFFHKDGARIVHVRDFPNGMANYSDDTLTAAGWESTDRLDGMACTYVRLEAHSGENAINSEPTFTADIQGTSYDNPALCLDDYLSNPIYGKGLDLSGDTRYQAAIDLVETICDTTVDVPPENLETRKLFTCNVALDTGQSVLENVNIILKSFRGWMPIIDGQLVPLVERDETPVSVEILESDIIKTGSVTNGGKSNRYNRVVVKYTEPEANGTKQEAVYPAKDSAVETAWLAADNGVLLEKSIDLPTCNNYFEAQSYAKAFAEVSREQLRTTIVLPLWATIYEVGDVVNVTHSFFGWSQKPFRIESTSESTDTVTLKLREHQPYLYDFYGEGNKPQFDDTNLTGGNPDAPTNLQVIPFYDEEKQVRVTWDSDETRFYYEIYNASGALIEFDRISVPYVDVRGFAFGTYTFKVKALAGMARGSSFASTDIIMQLPSPPTSLNITALYNAIEVYPVLAGIDTYTNFLFGITDPSITEPPTDLRGPSRQHTFPGLMPDTQYKIWVKTTQPIGVSTWFSQLVTTANSAPDVLAVLPPTLADDLVDPVANELSGQLQNVVDGALADYSTTTQVVGLIDDAVDLVNNIEGENPAIDVVNGVLMVLKDFKSEQDIDHEKRQRTTEVETLTAAVNNNVAEIETAKQVAADELQAVATQVDSLSSTVQTNDTTVNARITTFEQTYATEQQAVSTRIDTVDAAIVTESGLRQAAIANVQQTIATETSARAQAISLVQAEVDDNAAAITTVSDALATETSARALAITNLESSITGEGGAIEAAINEYDQTIVGPSGAIATSVDALRAELNGPSGPIQANTALAQQAQATADGNALALAGLQTRVETEEAATSAQLILNSQYDDSIGELVSRAFLGVSNTSNGVSTVTGIVIGGTENAINMQGDVFTLSDTQGNGRLYWTAVNDDWNFSGNLVAAKGTFAGSLSAATGTFSGTLSAGAILSSAINLDGGYLVSRLQASPDIRVVLNQGDYQIWVGIGSTYNGPGIFSVKNNGTTYIDRLFIADYLPIRTYAEAASHIVTTPTHASKGNDVSVTATHTYFRGYTTTTPINGGVLAMPWTIKRGATTIKSDTAYAHRTVRVEGPDYVVTETLSLTAQARDTGNSTGNYTYTFEIDDITGTGVSQSSTITTLETS